MQLRNVVLCTKCKTFCWGVWTSVMEKQQKFSFSLGNIKNHTRQRWRESGCAWGLGLSAGRYAWDRTGRYWGKWRQCGQLFNLGHASLCWGREGWKIMCDRHQLFCLCVPQHMTSAWIQTYIILSIWIISLYTFISTYNMNLKFKLEEWHKLEVYKTI